MFTIFYKNSDRVARSYTTIDAPLQGKSRIAASLATLGCAPIVQPRHFVVCEFCMTAFAHQRRAIVERQ